MVNHQAGPRLVRLFRPECLAHFGFLSKLEGSKGLNNGLCFSLLKYRFALTYKPEFRGILFHGKRTLLGSDRGLDPRRTARPRRRA
jgi:hypothetical protein